MPRAGARRRSEASAETRERLVTAATTLVATEGFAAATARAIGAEADCNPALVFYHYGSLNGLLLEALDASNEQSLSRYREALAAADSVRDLVGVVRDLYPEDHRSGHITLMAQLVAGGIVDRDLGRQVTQRVQPWLELTRDAVEQALPVPLRRRFPSDDVSYLIVAAALGAELLATLSNDHGRNRATLQRLTGNRGLLRGFLSSS